MIQNKIDTLLKESNGTENVDNISKFNKRKKPKLLVMLNTFLCFIVILIASSALILNMCGREILVEQTVEKSVEQIDEKTLSNFIHSYITDSRIGEDNIENIISETDVMEFIRENIGNYSNYLLDGEELKPLTADAVIEYIEENKELIRKETGLKYVEADKEELRKEIEKPLDDFNSKLEGNIGVISSTFSLPFMILMIVVLVLVFAQWCFIYVKNSVSIIRLFKLYGIALLIPSFIFSIVALFLNPILKNALPDKYSFITTVTGDIRKTILLNVGILVIISLAMIIISITMSKISGAIKGKKLTQTQTVAPVIGAVENNNTQAYENVNNAEIANYQAVQDVEQDNDVAQSVDIDLGSVENSDIKFKFCTECGNKLKENAVFCAKCGKKMN